MSESAHMMDQRCAKRIAIGEKVEFRCNNDEDFRDATMVDFSETGMLLMMGEKHTEGTQFEVRVKEEESIYFTVKCMRIAHCSDVDSFSYGCQIEEHRIESNN
jgi:c-di-GMP-binding flagellar brake protein YcgR